MALLTFVPLCPTRMTLGQFISDNSSRECVTFDTMRVTSHFGLSLVR